MAELEVPKQETPALLEQLAQDPAVFPGPTRDQIGILESTGKITLHKFRE